MSIYAVHMTPEATPTVDTAQLLIAPPSNRRLIFLGSVISVLNPAAEDLGLAWYFADDDGAGGLSPVTLVAQPLDIDGGAFGGTLLEGAWATTPPTLGERFAKKIVDARVGWEFWPTPFAQSKSDVPGVAADGRIVLRVEDATLSQGSLNCIAYVEIG